MQCPICSEVPLPDYVRSQLENNNEPARHTWSGAMPSPPRLTAAQGSPARQSNGHSSVPTTPVTPQTGPLWPGPRQLPPQTRATLPQTRTDLSQHWEPRPEPQRLKPPGTTTWPQNTYYDRPTAASYPTLHKDWHVPQSEEYSHRRQSGGLDAGEPYSPSRLQHGSPTKHHLRPPSTMASFPEPMRLPQTGVLSSRTSNSARSGAGNFSADQLTRYGNASGDQLAPPKTAMQLSQMPGSTSLSRGLPSADPLRSGYPSAARVMPQTEVSLQGNRSTGAQGEPPRCFHCNNNHRLRRVKCCEKHYCLVCLQDMITEGQRNNVLRCSYCGAPWDLSALSNACGVSPSRTGPPGRQLTNVSPPPSFGRTLY